VRSLAKLTGSQRQSLEPAGLSRSTGHYRQNPRGPVQDPIGQSERAYKSRISTQNRDRISEYILAGWADQVSVDHSFATA
jgi:putative transposase